jgi:ribonuclease BN (tRNA processing enzyme)
MTDIRITFLGTGAGNCIHRAHTAIVLDCADGTRVLIDTGSGNGALRHGAMLNMLAEHFDLLLLTHRHLDHMGGLPFLQGQRTLMNPQSPPIKVYSSEESLLYAGRLIQVSRPALRVDQDAAYTPEGHPVFRWHPTQEGERLQLGPTTYACPFAVDHLPGAVGWRVESDGIAIVFSGDTKFSPSLPEWAKDARLLIHEALSTERERERTYRRGHSTAADAGRAASLASVSELIITHIDSPFHVNTQPLLDEARQQFDGPVSVAHDLHQVTIGVKVPETLSDR